MVEPSMWTRDWRYAPRVRGGLDRRVLAAGRRTARCGFPLVLILLAVPAASGEEIAVRVRDHGRVDVHATAAPLAAVLGRLAALTDMTVAYLGPPPERLATMEISSASQAEAVLNVLHGFGADYAVSTDSAGTRILTVVVAEAPAGGGSDREAVASEPLSPDGTPPEESPDASFPDALLSDTPAPDSTPAGTPDPGSPEPEGLGGTEGFPVLPGTFVPGVRATGQTTEWGVPPFVLPDPPGPKATEGTSAPSDAGPPGPVSPSPAPPSP
jgi:hypothetical protein